MRQSLMSLLRMIGMQPNCYGLDVFLASQITSVVLSVQARAGSHDPRMRKYTHTAFQ